MKRFRLALSSTQRLSRLWDWRVPVLLMILGGAYLFDPPLWDAISVSPQRRVEPLKQRIAELDKRIKAAPTPSTADLKELATLEKGRIDAEHTIRTTAVQAIAGLFVVFTAIIGWKNLQATNEKQIAERFSKAIEQLGNDNIHVRLGGIYALEQITKDDEERYYWQVLETLTSYVRERSPWPPKTPTKHSSLVESVMAATESNNEDTVPSLPTDIQAVMIVLSRRKHHYGHHLEPHRLDLRKVDLRGLQLPEGAELRGIDFSEANLRQAILESANLQQAILESTNLQQADLQNADLQQVSLLFANLQLINLNSANLQQAFLKGADLQLADLGEANLQQASLVLGNLQQVGLWEANLQQTNLASADLQRANLRQANLQGAKLISANLQQAFLRGTNLQQAFLGGANLHQTFLESAKLQGTQFKETNPEVIKQFGKHEAIGLTWEQVEQAAGYTEELLPDYLLEQRRTASGEEGEKPRS